MTTKRFASTKDPEIFRDTISGIHYFRGTPVPGKGEVMRSLKAKTFGLASMAKKNLLLEIRGIDPKSRNVTVGDMFTALEKEQENKSKSTLNKCKAAKKALEAKFENMPVSRVSQEHYDEYVAQARRKNPKRKLENDILHLNMIMLRAYSKGIVPRPLTFKNPDKKRQKKRSPTSDEIRALFELVPKEHPELTRFLTIGATMGCRPGEILSLEWKDIDLKRGLLTILAEKNKNGRTRTIAMSPAVWEMLKEWRHACEGGAVFPPRFKDQAKPWLLTIDGPFEALVLAAHKAERLVKDDITPNSLRHYFATEAARQIKAHKTDILHVCDYLDHSLDTYKENYLDLHEEDTRHVAGLVEVPL